MEELKALKAQFDKGAVSATDYEARRKEIIKNLTGTDVKKTPAQESAASFASSSVPPPVTSVGLYAKVAPAARDAYDPRFGNAPKNVMEKGQRPEDFRLEHDPHYPFGDDKAVVGDADQLQSFLDDLEVKLQGVKTYHERHKEIQDQLPAGMRLGKMPVTGRNEDKPSDKIKPSMMMIYAKNNDVKNLEIMLKMGVPVDYRDEDTGNTPLMVACQSGQRQAMFYLVEQGANVNAQNIYGAGPLHELIKNKRENLAVWLIKHGADIYMEDKRTYSPYDLALPWFQKDMKKIAADVDITKRYEVNEATQTTYSLTKNHTEEKPQGIVTAQPVKVFFQNDSYKTLFVEPEWTSRVLVEKVCEKLGMESQAKYFQLLEHIKGKERKVELDANILQTKKKWPLIYGPSGSDTDKYCRFIVLPRSDAPSSVIEDFNHYSKAGDP